MAARAQARAKARIGRRLAAAPKQQRHSASRALRQPRVAGSGGARVLCRRAARSGRAPVADGLLGLLLGRHDSSFARSSGPDALIASASQETAGGCACCAARTPWRAKPLEGLALLGGPACAQVALTPLAHSSVTPPREPRNRLALRFGPRGGADGPPAGVRWLSAEQRREKSSLVLHGHGTTHARFVASSGKG